MAPDLHLATWDGPFVAELADMTTLAPGHEHLVTAEDLKSAHWKPVKRAKGKNAGDKPAEGSTD